VHTTRVRDTVPPSARTALKGTQLLATDLRAPSRSSCDTLHDRFDRESQVVWEPPQWFPEGCRHATSTNLRSAQGQPAVVCNAMLMLQPRLNVLLRQIFRRAELQA
jgi:hypothetical protein